jgi:hypothetical protein
VSPSCPQSVLGSPTTVDAAPVIFSSWEDQDGYLIPFGQNLGTPPAAGSLDAPLSTVTDSLHSPEARRMHIGGTTKAPIWSSRESATDSPMVRSYSLLTPLQEGRGSIARRSRQFESYTPPDPPESHGSRTPHLSRRQQSRCAYRKRARGEVLGCGSDRIEAISTGSRELLRKVELRAQFLSNHLRQERTFGQRAAYGLNLVRAEQPRQLRGVRPKAIWMEIRRRKFLAIGRHDDRTQTGSGPCAPQID